MCNKRTQNDNHVPIIFTHLVSIITDYPGIRTNIINSSPGAAPAPTKNSKNIEQKLYIRNR